MNKYICGTRAQAHTIWHLARVYIISKECGEIAEHPRQIDTDKQTDWQTNILDLQGVPHDGMIMMMVVHISRQVEQAERLSQLAW